jgi:hypothetical protein
MMLRSTRLTTIVANAASSCAVLLERKRSASPCERPQTDGCALKTMAHTRCKRPTTRPSKHAPEVGR